MDAAPTGLPLADPSLVANLTDALARGRLVAAEIAAISPMELDALFELGARRLDTRRDADAVEIFAGLTSLFPYSAKYWRAYGIALHCLLELERARAAYDAALLLAPSHPDTLCYRGEVLVYLGEMAAAQADLEAVKKTTRQDLRRRADALLACIDALSGWQPRERTATVRVQPGAATFTLGDGRSLPLRDGRYVDDVTDVFEPLPEEVTETCTTFVPEVADLWQPRQPAQPAAGSDPAAAPAASGEASLPKTAPAPLPMGEDDTRGVTATQPLRQVAAARMGSGVWERAPGREATDTAVLPRRLAFPPSLAASPSLAVAVLNRETAVLPGRPLAEALAQIRAARVARNERKPDAGEITQTAIVRRRLQLPLCEED